MFMYTRVGLEGVEEPKEDWNQNLSRLLLTVEVFGSTEAALGARRLFKATTEMETGTVGAIIRASEAEETYRQLVQEDLGLPPTDLPTELNGDDPEAEEAIRQMSEDGKGRGDDAPD